MKRIIFIALVLSFLAVTCADEESSSENGSQGNQQMKNVQDSLFNVFERLSSNINRNQSMSEEKSINLHMYNIKSLSLSVPPNTNCSEKMPEAKPADLQSDVLPSKSDYNKLLERITELETVVLQNQKSAEEQINDLKANILLLTAKIDTKKPKKIPDKVEPCENINSTGVYKNQKLNKDVYCEMESNFGAGWLVIQQRISSDDTSSEDDELFDVNWAEYRAGFGTVGKETEFWLGLEAMHQLTTGGNYELVVEIKDDDDEYEYARYAEFKLSGEDDKYRITVGGFSGTANNQLGKQNSMQFTTKDSDNDKYGLNCAYTGAGWWYNTCDTGSSLNDKNPYWYPIINGKYSRMMIRRK